MGGRTARLLILSVLIALVPFRAGCGCVVTISPLSAGRNCFIFPCVKPPLISLRFGCENKCQFPCSVVPLSVRVCVLQLRVGLFIAALRTAFLLVRWPGLCPPGSRPTPPAYRLVSLLRRCASRRGPNRQAGTSLTRPLFSVPSALFSGLEQRWPAADFLLAAEPQLPRLAFAPHKISGKSMVVHSGRVLFLISPPPRTADPPSTAETFVVSRCLHQPIWISNNGERRTDRDIRVLSPPINI